MSKKQKLPIPRAEILDGAEKAFYVALLAGYAGSCPDLSVLIHKEKNDYSRRNTVLIGEYEVIDEWDVNPFTDCSAGRTRIRWMGFPIWVMTYAGSYPDEVIPMLKAVLKATYESQRFWGCRGKEVTINGCNYRNQFQGCFASFWGTEEIDRSGEILGFHKYAGRALI